VRKKLFFQDSASTDSEKRLFQTDFFVGNYFSKGYLLCIHKLFELSFTCLKCKVGFAETVKKDKNPRKKSYEKVVFVKKCYLLCKALKKVANVFLTLYLSN